MAKRRKKNVDEENGPPQAKRMKPNNRTDKADDDDDDEPQNYRTIKCALKTIVKKPYQDYLTAVFFNRSFELTKLSFLASAYLLYKVNTAVDQNDRQFFEQDSDKLIRHIFDAVSSENIGDATKMEPEFRAMVEQHIGDPNFQWPSKSYLSRSFEYYITTYKTNVKNNLIIHCQTRVRYFLRMQCFEMNLNERRENNGIVNEANEYDDTDILNTMKALFNNEDWTEGDENRKDKLHTLRNKVIELGFPDEWFYLKAFVKHNWLRSMWMFVIIQREVEAFLIKYNFLSEQWGQYNRDKHSKNKPLNLKQPTVARPPTVRNFTVVPLCRFQLKHIRIDHSDLYRITNDMGLIRRKMLSAETGNLNKADDAYFRQYKEDLFGMMFNMKKIKRIAKKNKMNDFHFQVLTDGVSVSLLFKKPKQKIDNEAADQHLRDLYAEKRVKWEIGIDANVRTYLAVVARDVETGAEVSNKHFLLLFG